MKERPKTKEIRWGSWDSWSGQHTHKSPRKIVHACDLCTRLPKLTRLVRVEASRALWTRLSRRPPPHPSSSSKVCMWTHALSLFIVVSLNSESFSFYGSLFSEWLLVKYLLTRLRPSSQSSGITSFQLLLASISIDSIPTDGVLLLWLAIMWALLDSHDHRF